MCKIKLLFIILLFSLLTACGTRTTLAPVVEGWKQPSSKSGAYTVQPGDTLYSIAWAFDMDYRDLARINHLSPNTQIKPGQRLRMHAVSRKRFKAPVRYKPRVQVAKAYKRSPPSRWRWPARGRVVERFSLRLGKNKGINIAGRIGEPIRATASGRVVYSGTGLRGYGKLIIIKHSDTFLSAYAYNKKILVREGERIKAGQTIAQMGKSYKGKTELHFEIRRNGKPVNPLRYLRRG